MRFLNNPRIQRPSRSARSPERMPCRHANLSAMRESVADMGERDKINRYRCLDCQQILSEQVGRSLQRYQSAHEVERVTRTWSGGRERGHGGIAPPLSNAARHVLMWRQCVAGRRSARSGRRKR